MLIKGNEFEDLGWFRHNVTKDAQGGYYHEFHDKNHTDFMQIWENESDPDGIFNLEDDDTDFGDYNSIEELRHEIRNWSY